MGKTEIVSEFVRSVYRTHSCGELRIDNASQEVIVSGWVMRRRDHGGVVFIDLRDNYGITQVVFSGAVGEEAQKLKLESVIKVKGLVKARTGDLVNPKIPTGEIEVHATELVVLSSCDILPFPIADDEGGPEAIRLKYRFLELRREKLHSHIATRVEVIKAVREIMQSMGFTEFQTPILTSSSPEGARDFIVPSRLHPGKFYALPQAPQQFKQLLMIAGFDRYFQIAPCFRDEDARADRSPGEFYQIDFEMSFVEQDNVLSVIENLIGKLIPQFSTDLMCEVPFPRIKYREAFERFGTDKPDLRVAFEIKNITNVFKSSQFRVFKETIEKGRAIRAIKIELDAIPPRKYFDDTISWFSGLGEGLGVAYLAADGEGFKGNIAKFVAPDEVAALKKELSTTARSVVFVAAGADETILPALGKLRIKLGKDFNQFAQNSWKFCWVTDFPFYEKNSETGAVDFAHNPFSMPQGGLDALLTKNPFEIDAYQYDLVGQGLELASGAIRNHTPEIMYKAFEIAGYSKDIVDEKFGGMIRAFKFGAPPHGGAALGLERLIMLLVGEEAIREVITFPMAQNGEDLLMGAPSGVSEKQLREVHIKLRQSPDQSKDNVKS